MELIDPYGRTVRDLRISVTDRCNFRCTYCMPKEVFDRDYRFLPHGDLLSFEEITRLARIFIDHGVEKIRLTGGEPLLRKNIERLIEMLASLRTREGAPLDLTLTTNGSVLARKARKAHRDLVGEFGVAGNVAEGIQAQCPLNPPSHRRASASGRGAESRSHASRRRSRSRWCASRS